MCTINGTERVHCYSAQNYRFRNIPYVKGRKKKTGYYIPYPVTYDIECSTYEGVRDDKNKDWIETPYALMYHWQICFAGDIIMGRTWDDFKTFINRMIDFYHLDDMHRVIIYCHNLGYEWQHTQCFIDGTKDIFAVKSRTPLVIRTDMGLEFRCSWKLSNMSLEKFCKNERDCKYQKAVGDLDYYKFRTPDTPLTRTERMYCASDVKSLYHAIMRRMKDEHDDLEHIPLTSTGYVRRHVRGYCDANKDYRKIFLDCRLSPEAYRLLRNAAGGGDTHANRYLSTRIWPDCDSYDERSSYPYVMLTKKYPMTRFRRYGDIESKSEFYSIINNYACVFEILFENIEIKPGKIDPIISSSKCKIIRDAVYDNGRILKASVISITITDIDYKEIILNYEYDTIRVRNMYVAKYGMLPEPIRQATLDLYLEKCELSYKIETIESENPNDYMHMVDWINLKYLYNKCKNRLNGIFGMMFTDPVRANIWEDDNLIWHDVSVDISNTGSVKEKLDDYYNKRSSFVNFQWGVWTTAHARAHLQRLQRAGSEDGGQIIYWDTDSIKGFNLCEEAIARENRAIEKECESLGAYCVVNGVRYYLGIYEKEPHMNRFITLGAKKYAYENDKGELKITISGVSKEKGVKELGCLENFKTGFIFREAAALKFYYDDVFPHYININGKNYITASSAAAISNTYKLGITEDYDDLIQSILNGDASYEI